VEVTLNVVQGLHVNRKGAAGGVDTKEGTKAGSAEHRKGGKGGRSINQDDGSQRD